MELSGLKLASQQDGRKRSRTAAARSESSDLSRDVARLALSLAAQLRLVHSAAIRTFIFPNSHNQVIAGRRAGVVYSEAIQNRQGTQTLGPPHLYVFAAMVQAAKQDPGTGMDLAALLNSFEGTPTEMMHLITVCRFTKCFDKNKTRLEIAATDEGRVLVSALARSWLQSGAVECCGMAPRGPLERNILRTLTDAASHK